MRFVFGEYELEIGTRTLQQRGERVPVEPKVFDLLVYLIEHRERVVSPNELLDTLWPGVSVTPAALSRTVQKARQAVGDDGEHQTVLRTEHGHGFRFVAEVTVLPAGRARTRRNAAAAAMAGALVVAAAGLWMWGPAPASLPGAQSIAVLPFVNISSDPENAYFTDGIHDEVLSQLSKIRDLKVISRTSVMRYRGEDRPSSPEIAAALGVANLLEGTVRLAGNRVRITTQLIDAKSDDHLWAETYDRELTATNLFSIQSEIAKTVADALRATLSQEERDSIETVPTESLAAYQAYLLGRRRMAKTLLSATAEAIGYFQQAIEYDPSFALAYAALADGYVMWAWHGGSPRDDALTKADIATSKALELDDQLGAAYNSLAGVKEERGDFEGAEAAYRRALELNPNYALAYEWYGDLLFNTVGRSEEALAMHLRAVELDPLSAVRTAAVALDLHALGRFDESLVWFENALEIDPDYRIAYLGMGRHHWLVSGQLDEAVIWYMKVIFLFPGDLGALGAREMNYLSDLGWIFLDLGDPDRAEYWFERSIELAPERIEARIGIAFLHLYRGDEAGVLDSARRILADFPRSGWARGFLRNHELSVGRYAEARALYEKAYPELLNEDAPKIGGVNYWPAIKLALVLSKTGERKRADLLLKRASQYLQSLPHRSGLGHETADAQILSLQGEKQKALSALRQWIDEGWRSNGRYVFKHEPILESLYDEPEFQAMVAEIEADMAEQLARVREMERAGELAAIPQYDAALH